MKTKSDICDITEEAELATRTIRNANAKSESPFAIAKRGRQKLNPFSFAASIKYMTGMRHSAAMEAYSKTVLPAKNLLFAEKTSLLKKAILRVS